MATPKAAWGIEIGAHAIKALRLEREGEQVSVSDFAVIPHKKVLTTPDLDRDEMIRLGLGQFISQKTLENEHLVMSVPGHSAFARFAKLPPVEPKKVPDIVKFEAVQQIPFPIEEVEWDYQTFSSPDSPETEVGIFAITRERVQHMLHLYSELGVSPECLTLSPVAVYNAMAYDHELAGRSEPIMFLDIGTQATDVIIANEGRCWIRTFPLGGTHFTEAIASAFKLSYSKAEKLKLEAATSKYAKQIMQAMRPVFSDLLQDLQRSIGYYHSMHREVELDTIVGIGSTFKIPGLRKFIGQQLQVNVVRLDEYKKIQVTGREAASFAEHAVNFAPAYGLALQGVGLAQIDANLVPVKSLREQMWHNKTKWFAAAAAIVIVGASMTLYRPLTEGAAINDQPPSDVTFVVNEGKRIKQQYEQLRANTPSTAAAENMLQLLEHRDIWPHLLQDAAQALKEANPQPALLSNQPDDIRAIPTPERRLVKLNNLTGRYAYDGDSKTRRMNITMEVEVTRSNPDVFLNSTVARWLRNNAQREGVPYRIVPGSVSINPDQLTRLVVEGDDLTRMAGGRSDRGSGAGGGNWQAPSPPPPPPDRPGAGSTGGSGGGGMFGDGPQGSRRTPTGTPRSAPGAGALGGDGGSGGSSGGTGFAGAPSAPRSGGSAAGPKPSASAGNLDELAPIPKRPNIYNEGDVLYQLPITFTIELIDPDDAMAGPQQPGGTSASAANDSEVSS